MDFPKQTWSSKKRFQFCALCPKSGHTVVPMAMLWPLGLTHWCQKKNVQKNHIWISNFVSFLKFPKNQNKLQNSRRSLKSFKFFLQNLRKWYQYLEPIENLKYRYFKLVYLILLEIILTLILKAYKSKAVWSSTRK